STFTAPEEPILFIYPATQEERNWLQSFIRTAAADLKGVTIIPDQTPNQVSVWAKPSEQKLIAAVLKQMQENQANETPRQLKVFQLSVGDLKTAQEILTVSHPDAKLFADLQGNRLLVWATPSDLEKITQSLGVQGSIENRQMLAYPIAGPSPETIAKVIQDVFQGLKITPEPQTRRILIWATPEEHVTIAEIIEQANKDVTNSEDSELSEKFVAYSSVNLDPVMIRNLVAKMFPNADIFADVGTDKITIRARSREHKRIAELLEQLREKDDTLRPVLAIYPFGETDPVMVEAMLRSQLSGAESMTSIDIVYRLNPLYYYERMPWYRSPNASKPKKLGYYKVDPRMQAVYVFVTKEDQDEVALAMKQIIDADTQEGNRAVVKRYSLDEMSFYDIYSLLEQIAPSATFDSIYTYNANNRNYRASYKEFLAYTRESEHAKIEALVNELNLGGSVGAKEVFSFFLSAESKQSRDNLIETIQKIEPDVLIFAGNSPNQILIWAAQHKIEKLKKVVAELEKVSLDDAQVVKSYPLRFLSIASAKSWLSAICPNAIFDPNRIPAPPIRPVQPGEPTMLVVLATPVEHLKIEKALSEMDVQLPETHLMSPRFYSLDDYPAGLYYSLFLSLRSAFPNALCSQGAELHSILVVANEEDHKKIATFLKSYKEERESKRATLEVYALKKLNYYKVVPLIQRIAPPPTALILPATKPEQIGVWATPKEHRDIAAALARLEAAALVEENQALRVYKVGNKKAQLSVSILNYQFPGALSFAINPDEILVWACATDHESVTKMLETVSEAFPEPFMKTYFFKHIPIREAFTTLNTMYSSEATISVLQQSGDLVIYATQSIHDKIAKNLSAIDLPRPSESEALPVVYDLSDIPLAQIGYAAQSIRSVLPQAVLLPSSIPGQLVVWARMDDQQKIRSMVDQMLAVSPQSLYQMQTYQIRRGTAVSVTPTLMSIAPNAKFSSSVNPNQLLVWAKTSDQQRIESVIETLNRGDLAVQIETYSLKNTYAYSARQQVQSLISSHGLDAKIEYDLYGNRLIVQASAEDQKIIAGLLEKLRTEERELEVFPLENTDPVTAYTAISTLFADESYYTAPSIDVDQSTNILFVQGTREQLEKTRRLLINMGESHLLHRPADQLKSLHENGQTSPQNGESSPGYSVSTGSPTLRAEQSRLRIIRVEGDVKETIRELEKQWPQFQQNRLLINHGQEPLIQQKEEPKSDSTKPDATKQDAQKQGGMFAISETETRPETGTKPAESKDDVASVPNIESESTQEKMSETTDNVAPTSPQSVQDILQTVAPNVYVTVNDDGSLTVASYDTEALDQLEKILGRIKERVVFEGRDYTIYSVRNISATVVALKLQLILRERLAGRQNRAFSAQLQSPGLEITPDESTNTIYVRGGKAERKEVANLIAMLDVSELPGERSVRKPIKVPIKNTHAVRVAQQVLNVYQQKIMATRLPGGVYPRVTVDNVTNSIEIIAPEPLASELREYAEDLDRRTIEEPARKVHVIPLEVKSGVIQNALQVIRQSAAGIGY
ncbi:MAG: secretin N-terminal domain-containing protein, partial [Thermoguttaceae bacterium]